MNPLPSPAPVLISEVLSSRSGITVGRGKWCERTVFVKALMTDDPERVTMFHHEGEVAFRATSRLVMPLLAHTATQLIFPFSPRGSLRDLARCGPMSAEEATAVTWGVLLAVRELHQRGIVHHDLKPENVLLCRGEARAEAVRLIDFGMSYAADLKLDIHSGTRMGTPHFMAPEQFLGIRGDPRSDLYSVGVLLFDCLAGHPPYEDALGWL